MSSLANDRGQLWRPALSGGRFRHVIAVLVPDDAIVMDVNVVRRIFGPRTEPESDVAHLYEVVLCGEHSDELAPLETVVAADTVIVPGVGNPLTPRGIAVIDALRAAYAAGARMVAFGTGAFLLGYAGVLDGRRATTHWQYAREFRERFPSTSLDTELPHVDDNGVHTGGGVLPGVDLTLHLLSLDLGRARAEAIARAVIAASRRVGVQSRRDDEEPMAAVMTWLRDHLHEPLSLARVAEESYLSERSLVRKFRAATGTTIFEWVNRERIDRAKLLLQATDRPITEIAAVVGFGSPETLRRNFQRHVGTTARSYRHKFRPAADG